MNKQKNNGEYLPLVEALRAAYRAGQGDEAFEPIVKVDSQGNPKGRFQKGDYVVFYNIRGEREVQITQSLTDDEFNHFLIKKGLSLNFVTMIEYDSHLKVKVAFSSEKKINNTLTEVITKAGLKLVKISESEKEIHVGFFMNGKNEKVFPGEERVVVPSPENVSSFASRPEMSADQVTDEISSKIDDSSNRVIVANLANVDVVGHTEDRLAVINAVETVDRQLGRILKKAKSQNVTLIVTSDHGTVEEWLYPDGTINTGHTKSDVPFILADFSFSENEQKYYELRQEGELTDVAPTILELLCLEIPIEMTGISLFSQSLPNDNKGRRVLLVILDGWGAREEKEGNLISEALTPNFDRLWKNFPHSILKASGEAVGMPPQTVGNSEAGHLHLGAGRRVLLDRVKIDNSILEKSFFSNKAFLWAMEGAKREKKSLHLLGIVSFYSSHGTIDHLFALLQMAKNMDLHDIYIHSLIGRRGEKPESGAVYIEEIKQKCKELSLGEVVTVMGRFWALDREENWDRVEKAYRALVFGDGIRAF